MKLAAGLFIMERSTAERGLPLFFFCYKSKRLKTAGITKGQDAFSKEGWKRRKRYEGSVSVPRGGSETGKGGKETKPFDIVDYNDKTPGIENHHGVLDVWATNNIDGYKSRAGKSTTIALTKEQHNATKAVYRDWLYEKTGKKVGGKIDWTEITPNEVQSLSERMFNAAGVPDYARRNYYNEFNKYIYGIGE